MFATNGIPIACESLNVQAVYIPNGKTMPQSSGVYLNCCLRTTNFQIPKIIKSGIHHVPNDQKNSVNPFANVKISVKGPPILGMVKHIMEPARVVIAIAPMLIQ